MDVFILTAFSIEISVNNVDPEQMLHLCHLNRVCTVCIILQNGIRAQLFITNDVVS